MTKNEIEKNSKFMRVCSKYDIYSKNAIVYNDLILLNVPGKDIYILLDKDYNTIAIEQAYITNIDKYINSLYQEYFEYGKTMCFSYPFDKITYKQIIDFSNRITLSQKDNTILLTLNGINCIYKPNDDYSKLLAYIKFLGKEIKNYQLYIFINKQMGIEVPDVASHIAILINKINEFIESCVVNKKVICTDELIEYMNNEDFEYYEYKFLLNEVISLLLKQKGYKIENEKLEKTPISSISNLSDKAYQLFEILKISKTNVRQKNDEDEIKDIFEIIELEDRTFGSDKLHKIGKKLLKRTK